MPHKEDVGVAEGAVSANEGVGSSAISYINSNSAWL